MKKIISWSTPKHIKQKVEKVGSRPARSKYSCKKNKGEHEFVLVKKFKNSHIIETGFVSHFYPKKTWMCYECKHCGKQKTDFVDKSPDIE